MSDKVCFVDENEVEVFTVENGEITLAEGQTWEGACKFAFRCYQMAMEHQREMNQQTAEVIDRVLAIFHDTTAPAEYVPGQWA